MSRLDREIECTCSTGTTTTCWASGPIGTCEAPPGGPGHSACRRGLRVRYVRLPHLLHDLALAQADGSYGKLLTALAKTELLILDDWGLAPLGDRERRDVLEVVEDRYGRRATLVTSQLPVEHWHELIGDPHPWGCYPRPPGTRCAPDHAEGPVDAPQGNDQEGNEEETDNERRKLGQHPHPRCRCPTSAELTVRLRPNQVSDINRTGCPDAPNPQYAGWLRKQRERTVNRPGRAGQRGSSADAGECVGR